MLSLLSNSKQYKENVDFFLSDTYNILLDNMLGKKR